MLADLLRLDAQEASEALVMTALKQQVIDCALLLLTRGCVAPALALNRAREPADWAQKLADWTR